MSHQPPPVPSTSRSRPQLETPPHASASTAGAEKEQASSSSISPAIKDLISGEKCRVPGEADDELQKVEDIAEDFDALIPPDKPARQEDFDKLVAKGFDFGFTFDKPLGSGIYGTVWPCTFHKKLETGEIINKKLAFKTVAINRPESRKTWTIEAVERRINLEMRICELVIDNPHPNVARHELIYRIIEESITYQNPINHLIFMEQCDGSLTSFSIDPKYGYGFTIPDPNAVQNAIGNPQYHGLPEDLIKIFVLHIGRGLEFLHEQPKVEETDKSTGVKVTKRICVVHHDLKHDNVLFKFDSLGRIKFMLTDFGMSEVIELDPDDASKDDQTLKSTYGGGTPHFFPPEQKRMMTEYTKQAATLSSQGLQAYNQFKQQYAYDPKKKDVFALGVMMSDSLVGLTDRSQFNTLYQVSTKWSSSYLVKQDWNRYKDQFGVSTAFVDLMFWLTAMNPDHRPHAPDLLRHRWLKDNRFYGEYLDWKAIARRTD